MDNAIGPNPKVDAVLEKAERWREEYALLRAIALECGLKEDVKWGQPCYSDEGKNIVLIHGFKEYCAMLFFKGALLSDPEGILIQQTGNVQAARQVRFTDPAQVEHQRAALKAYIKAAIEVERAGLKVAAKETAEFPIPQEFQARLDQVPGLRSAFDALTPGRQRAYLLHFAGAKQAKTRASRVEACIPMILDGIGLHDHPR